MRPRARRVIVADLRGSTVALQPVPNGSGLSNADIRAWCTAAAIEPRTTVHATFIRLRELPDLEAYLSMRDVVVVRRLA
jgi:hypothetical protein